MSDQLIIRASKFVMDNAVAASVMKFCHILETKAVVIAVPAILSGLLITVEVSNA